MNPAVSGCGTVFPKGEKITNGNFTGTAWLQMLVDGDDLFHCPIGNVTFDPGCRNNWHRHPGGQILLITGGRGYYQAEGKPARVLYAGDVVRIEPNVRHWHGAAPDSAFSHLSIETNTQAGPVAWLEPVSDAHYIRVVKKGGMQV